VAPDAAALGGALAVYLLTFILAFGRRPLLSPYLASRAAGLVVLLLDARASLRSDRAGLAAAAAARCSACL